MSPTLTARLVSGAIAVVPGAGLLLQFILVLNGATALIPEAPPPLGLRVARFFSYVTIQANLIVLVVTTALARRPEADGVVWQVLRIDAMTGIVITGVVHFLLLRPLLALSGGSWVADKVLHLVVSALAVAGWLTRRALGRALAWPVAWLLVTLSVGWSTGWYPYPSLDARQHGTGSVAVYCVVIAAAFSGVSTLVLWVDRQPPRWSR